MLTVISPSKTLDFDTPSTLNHSTCPVFLSESAQLMQYCCELDLTDLETLMKISRSLAQLTKTRFANWHTPFTLINARQAILAFKGDVYEGLQATDFSQDDLQFAQQNLVILSGLYGLLRPLDLIQPYRLEMGIKLPTLRGSNLYQFWNNQLCDYINSKLAQQTQPILINLASDEYFKVLTRQEIKGQVIKPIFLDEKNGYYKVISFYAKKARGQLSRFIIKHKLTEPTSLKDFAHSGYKYDPTRSSETEMIFTRNEKADKSL